MRSKLKQRRKVGSYFLAQRTIEFVHSGCCVLDCCLGGGWPLGRIANVVGDRSSGKTLLAIEAVANFLRQYPDGRAYYLEAEAAFDKQYAAALGMPVERVTFIDDCDTVEELFRVLTSALRDLGKKRPAIFVVDSLDSLSDEAELGKDISKGSFGAEKAKKLSQTFRRLVRKVKTARMFVLIISQVRDKIGVMFGSKTSRSGGKALDFYAAQILYLHEAGKIIKTVAGVKRPTGVHVRAKVNKNKVGLPFRQCEFSVLFGYGVDSVARDWPFYQRWVS